MRTLSLTRSVLPQAPPNAARAQKEIEGARCGSFSWNCEQLGRAQPRRGTLTGTVGCGERSTEMSVTGPEAYGGWETAKVQASY